MEKVDIASGLYVPKQVFLDAKNNVASESTLSYLGVDNNLALTYPKGIVIKCSLEGSYWEWRERSITDGSGLISTDYTYPANVIVDGVEYSNKVYNFFNWFDVIVANVRQPNSLVRAISPSLVGKTYTYPAYQYEVIIDKTHFINSSAFVTTIADATDNYKRVDLIYMYAGGVLGKLQGIESLTNATARAVPNSAVAIGYINVFGNTIIPSTDDPNKENIVNKVSDIEANNTSTDYYPSTKATWELFKKYRDYVIPQEFGAIGNGIVDDTVAIQAAVNSGYPVGFGGSNFTYLISSPITIPDDGSVFG